MADGDQQAAMTPVGDEVLVLTPGNFWIELEVDRDGADQAMVERAMTQAGFLDVRLDKEASAGGSKPLAGLFGAGTFATTLSTAIAPKPILTTSTATAPKLASTALSAPAVAAAAAPAPAVAAASPIANLLARASAPAPTATLSATALPAAAAATAKPASQAAAPLASASRLAAVSRPASAPTLAKTALPAAAAATAPPPLPPPPGPMPSDPIAKAIWVAKKAAYDAAVAAAAKAKAQGRRGGLFGPGGGGGSGSPPDGGGEAPPPPAPVPDPKDDRFATDPSTGNRYYMDPNTGTISLVDPRTGGLVPLDQETLAPVPGAAEQPAPGPPSPDGGGGGAPGGGGDLPDDGGGFVGPDGAAVSDDGQGGFVDAQGRPVDPAAVQPATTDTTAQPLDLAPGTAPPADMPLGEDPAYAIHVDEISGTSPNVYRMIARAPDQLVLRNGPGIWWKSVRRLSIDPYADVPLKAPNFQLARGQLYELLFFSRDKKARTRGDVWTLLQAMGFAPRKMLLVKRDVRLPPRGSQGLPPASVSVWMALARWDRAPSITTAEDPFFFADVRPAA